VLQSKDRTDYRCRTIGASHFPENGLQCGVFVPNGPSACENLGIMSCHYSDWFVEARQIGFEL